MGSRRLFACRGHSVSRALGDSPVESWRSKSSPLYLKVIEEALD